MNVWLIFGYVKRNKIIMYFFHEINQITDLKKKYSTLHIKKKKKKKGYN